MNGKTLETAGRLLFGQYWRYPFEQKFGLDNRSLRRMLKDEQGVPAGLVLDVEQALRDHANAVDAILDGLAA